ncbi:MAG TPA: alpha/beta fold hydrolase [Steroidobacteraceae bacterium]
MRQLRREFAASITAITRKALTVLTLALPASIGLASGPSEIAGIEFEPCLLDHPLGVRSVSAECGWLNVPEDRARPEGRQIALHVARVPAISRRKQPDPLFLINGGPGGSAAELYTNAPHAFARIRRERDIILVDQRGTGKSNPLTCEFDETALYGSIEQMEALFRKCHDVLSAKADLAQYTTSIAVQDLDIVRQTLGYERINLYGVSYGTRVAQHYARRFPEHTRAMILDGIVPPELALGPTIALDAEQALNNVLERCAKDESCSKRFGDPVSQYRALRKALGEKPVGVTLPHPTTGEMQKLEFGPLHLAAVLRLGLYTSEQAALVPLQLHLANSGGNFVPLAGQLLVIANAMDKSIALGMQNSVLCAEDVPFYKDMEIDRDALAQTFIGTALVDAMEMVCRTWPRGPMDDDFHEPLNSDVPTLLLSGGNDPVTPPRFGEQAKRGLPESLHIVMPHLGHGQLGMPCMDRVMERFISSASVKSLDISCTKNVKPMPFFTSLSGPPA